MATKHVRTSITLVGIGVEGGRGERGGSFGFLLDTANVGFNPMPKSAGNATNFLLAFSHSSAMNPFYPSARVNVFRLVVLPKSKHELVERRQRAEADQAHVVYVHCYNTSSRAAGEPDGPRQLFLVCRRDLNIAATLFVYSVTPLLTNGDCCNMVERVTCRLFIPTVTSSLGAPVTIRETWQT